MASWLWPSENTMLRLPPWAVDMLMLSVSDARVLLLMANSMITPALRAWDIMSDSLYSFVSVSSMAGMGVASVFATLMYGTLYASSGQFINSVSIACLINSP